MTIDEEKARDVIYMAMKSNITISHMKNFVDKKRYSNILLSDSECKSIALNFPFGYWEIRNSFDRCELAR